MIVRIRSLSACTIIILVHLVTWFIHRGLECSMDNIIQGVKEITANEYDLAIGILSSPNNFEQRDALRKTWISEIDHLTNSKDFAHIKVKAWFIVGKDFCDIPPEFRFDPYTCEWWKLNVSEITEDLEFATCEASEKKNLCPPSSLSPVYQGFSFQVNHPIVVTKLGVLSEALSPTSNITIALLDGGSKEILIKASISSLQPGILLNGYRYRPVQQYILPKGYEGILLVEGHLLSSACVQLKWSTKSGLITYNRVYKSSDNADGLMFLEKLVVAPSIIAFATDVKKLKGLNNRKSEVTKAWQNTLHSMRVRLFKEVDIWDDIVLVDVLDVYRNLSLKMLKFFTWLSSSYNVSFFLKTDDDCILNLSVILHQLNNKPVFQQKKTLWWSRFRTQWPVIFFGKWKDYDYPSSIYPRFPCGGGYLLSADLVHWISHNAPLLHPFQGEDVSLGIWLAALNPYHVEDENWGCDASCTPESYSIAQLSTEEIYGAWKTYQKCGNLCYCM